jgi:hypothetical protein
VIEALLWTRPSRLKPADAKHLLVRYGTTLGQARWQRRAAVLLRGATPLLVPPAEAANKIDGELPPKEILRDLRLPYETVVVVFGAGFGVPGELRELLPSWDSAARRCRTLKFEAWLADVRARGGTLNGVVLLAGHRGKGLSQSVVWLLETADGEQFVVPGWRSRSVLDPVLHNVAGAVCWGGWFEPRAPAIDRPEPRDRGQKPPAVSQDRTDPVHVVRIKVNPPRRGGDPGRGGRGSPAPHIRRGHIRRGHWRRSRVGPRSDWHYEWRWIHATYVNGVPPPDSPTTVYVLPTWPRDLAAEVSRAGSGRRSG